MLFENIESYRKVGRQLTKTLKQLLQCSLLFRPFLRTRWDPIKRSACKNWQNKFQLQAIATRQNLIVLFLVVKTKMEKQWKKSHYIRKYTALKVHDIHQLWWMATDIEALWLGSYIIISLIATQFLHNVITHVKTLESRLLGSLLIVLCHQLI